MSIDAYASCPCGSGKKFKWCCQPIADQIDKAFAQHADGQHEAALRSIDELTRAHAGNPEAWGRKAQLLHLNGRTEEAEEALQKAFAINPNYPFGHLLRAMFLQAEGEVVGALMLLRKAAELYAPDAKEQLAAVYEMIGENELRRNRPVAARFAYERCLQVSANAELRQMFDALFGEASRLPASARREHRFLGLPAGAPADRQELWTKALEGAATGRLSDAHKAFESVTAADPGNAPAWFNLGLVRAWQGDNRGALAALSGYVEREPGEEAAAAAWALGEVLRLGAGM